MTKKKSTTKSALQEQNGILPPNIISDRALKTIKTKRKKQPTVSEIISGVAGGNVSMLSRAITLIESTSTTHIKKAKEVITGCLPHVKPSIRIGITGVPGVGKSTFIEAFGMYLIGQGKKVAVLAVDPSSTISRGSILGDKTRMEDLVKHDSAFIRPSPSGNSLGGVAQKTRETIILCETAGYDVIIIETVGVGQSETAVHGMVDFFLLLKLAGAGDELQGIKRGIIEMADAIVINKADGENKKAAQSAMLEFKRALHLYPEKTSGWQPKVTLCSALKNIGIEAVWEMILCYLKYTKENRYFKSNRILQNKYWLLQTIEEELKRNFYNNYQVKTQLKKQLQLVEQGKTTPFVAAEYLLNLKQS